MMIDADQAYFWNTNRDIHQGRVKTFQFTHDLLEELG